MKKFVFALTIMTLSIRLFAGHQKIPDDTLRDVIAPNNTLSLETIARGQPIYANSTSINYHYNNGSSIGHLMCHNGFYITSCIVTSFDKSSGTEFFGKQQVYLDDETLASGGYPMNMLMSEEESQHPKELESKIWRIEVIDDIKYIVHFYEDFCVYTSADTQFVLAG